MTDGKLDLLDEARRQWVANGYGDTEGQMMAIISVMRVSQILLARLEETVRPHGLSYAGWKMLVLLSFTHAGELPLNKISSRLRVHPASVTGVVDKLEQQGLLVRVPHPEDRRAVLARITSKGRKVAKESIADVNVGPYADLGLSESEIERLIKLLAKVRLAEDVVQRPAV